MKQNHLLLLAIIMFLAMPLEIPAQRTTNQRQTQSAPAPDDLKNTIITVAEQLKRLNRFVYVLGGVADGIEKTEEEIRQGRAPRSSIDQNDRNKEVVMQSIRNLRAGLVNLEVEFRTKDSLKPYVVTISGMTQMIGLAEDQAGDGKIRDAGRTLLNVSDKLVDTLATLP